jgi:hypothetical protein
MVWPKLPLLVGAFGRCRRLRGFKADKRKMLIFKPNQAGIRVHFF